MVYKVQILDKNLQPITHLVEFPPLDGKTRTVLRFSSKLSDYGECRFRVATKDPIWTTFGTIFMPFQNHVRIYENDAVVWQGVIINNPHRTTSFVEVQAYEYEYLFKILLLNHDTTGDQNYRTLNSGTLAATITALVNEAKTKAGTASPLNLLIIGTIENPNFPDGYVDVNNKSIAGQPWTFSPDFFLKFDYQTYEYVFQSLALYCAYDYELAQGVDGSGNLTLTFNFKRYIGNKNTDLTFEYGPYGAVQDYDSPLTGENLVNSLTGIGADNDYNIIALRDLPNNESIAKYGLVQGVAAYKDAKNLSVLRSRMTEEMVVSSSPDTELHLDLNAERTYKLSEYRIGDMARFIINDHYNQLDQKRRIIGREVSVDTLGRPSITLITNLPRDTQV